MLKKFLEEQLPKSLAALENLLKDNNGGDGFFVGDAVTSNYYASGTCQGVDLASPIPPRKKSGLQYPAAKIYVKGKIDFD